MRHAQNNNSREKNSQASSQEQQAQPQKPQHSADETGGWRLGPYGHLRSGGEPDEIGERKKKRRRTTMIIGIASLVFGIALIAVVMVVASPTSSFFQKEQRTQQGQATIEADGETDSEAGASDAQSDDSDEPDNDESNETESSSSQDAGEHAADGASVATEAGNAAGSGENSAEDISSGASSDAGIASSNGANEVRTNQLPDSSFLYDTDIAELAKADSFNDGQQVQIEGEVVGEPINDETDGAYRWIVVQDSAAENPSTIEVRVSADLIGAIDSFGAYGQKGSTVQVRGTYQLACADHQGLSDIHADEVQVLAQGETIEEPVNSVVLTSALIAIALGALLLVLYQVKREQTR